MSKKRKITPAMIRTATGRTPSQPEIPSSNTARDLAEKFRKRYPATAEIAKGFFRCKNPQLQQIPRIDLVNMDYATIEQRVASMSPAFAAPYGQPEKDNADE